MPRARILVVVTLLATTFSPFASAQLGSGVTSFTVSGDRAEATADVAGYGIELRLTFEEVIGLNAENLGLSAHLVDPLDLDLVSRLPDPLAVSVPAGLPVVVRIEPPASGGLSFSGVATLEVHTHELSFASSPSLRFFRAPVGGTFEDITVFMGMGSYRARGNVGDFSEFLIVADTRDVSVVVNGKFDRLEGLLAEFDLRIPSALATELGDLVDSARTAWTLGDPLSAIRHLESFSDTVEEHSGSDLPEVWRSARDVDNVAGELRSAASTLQFSLRLASIP